MIRPITLSLLSTFLLVGPARADLPEVAFGPIFERLCADIRTKTSCDDCECTPLTSSIDANHDTSPYAILVRLTSKPGAEVYKERFHLAVGSRTALKDVGAILHTEGSDGNTPAVDVDVHKTDTFDDTCLRCDHEGVGLVHIFDVTLKQSRTGQDEQHDLTEKRSEARALLTCFGAPMECYGMPLGVSKQTDRLSTSPGDKGKKGKKESWSRTWKIGGHNKMQIVFGAPTGNAAKDAKLLFDTESRELHFGEIPHRPTSIRVR